ncbi:hypothetical protein MJO28_004042 [Puccinia striiformis f. sp. tritici]|uniref:Uncharacterized protein n=1 Tax=Puccinia striiformis f. sp. tritici TaxID=168172 RepID=A0ACC0EPY7_9BASI|nr:hypothetical protein MJO28_004042 [Puccinia striiformis f. sp. tritici]
MRFLCILLHVTETEHHTVIAWFDNRRVIQSYLSIPFDQPVPAFEDSVAIQFSQCASPAAPVIDIDDIRTPGLQTVSVVGSPPRTAPVDPLDKGKERAVTPRPPVNSVDNDEERAATTRPSIDCRQRTDTRAGSTFTDRDTDGSSVDNGVGPEHLVLPLSPVGENNSYVRSSLHAGLNRKRIPRYIDDVYIIALQWSRLRLDRRNRYELFHTNCQLLRNSADDVIPFNNRFGTRAPRLTPPLEATARPTSQVPVAEGEGDTTPCPNRLPTKGAHDHTPGPTRFRY